MDALKATNPEPFSSAGLKKCVGIASHSTVLNGTDMAVCELDKDLSASTVWAWAQWPNKTLNDVGQETWYTERRWYSVGYPFNWRGGLSPGQVGDFGVRDFAIDRPNNCSVLKTGFFADEGWSGGPAITWDPGYGAILGGIVNGCVGPGHDPSRGTCADAVETQIIAGMRMGALIQFGIQCWDPTWGFAKWDREPVAASLCLKRRAA